MKRRLFAAWVVAALIGNDAMAKSKSGGRRSSSGGRSGGGRSRGCGSRGGPGYRKPNGQCAGWRDRMGEAVMLIESAHGLRVHAGSFSLNKVTSLDPGTDSTVRAAWFPT